KAGQLRHLPPETQARISFPQWLASSTRSNTNDPWVPLMSNTEHEVVRRAREAALPALESGRPASTGPNGPVVVIVVPPPAGGSSDAQRTGKPQAAIGESDHPSLEEFP